MGTALTVLGLLIIGFIGGVSALAFLGFRLGYRRPRPHEKPIYEILDTLEGLRKQLARRG